MKRDLWQNSFRFGEISPEMQGQTDSDPYRQGVKTAFNFLVRPQGGVTRRPGSKYLFEVKDSTKATRIIPFVHGSDRFLIEVGEGYVRFHKGDGNDDFSLVIHSGYVMPDTADDELTDWKTSGVYWLRYNVQNVPLTHLMGPIQITTTGTVPGGTSLATDYWLGISPFFFASSLTMPGNGAPTQIQFATSLANAEAGTWETITSAGSGVHTFTLNTANNVLEFPNDLVEADLAGLQYARLGKKLIITTGSKQQIVIEKLDGSSYATDGGDDDWKVYQYETYFGPWVTTQADMSQALRVGILDINWNEVGSGDLHAQDGQAWLSVDQEVTDGVADYLRVDDYIYGLSDDADEDWAVGKVASVDFSANDGLVVDMIVPFASSGETQIVTNFYAMRYPWNDTDGWAAATAWFQQRLWFGGGGLRPNFAFGSSLEGFNVFLPGDLTDGSVTSQTSIATDIAGDLDQRINAMAELESGLLLVTPNSVWGVRPYDTAAGIAPTNIKIDPISNLGGKAVQPVIVNDSMLYLSGTGRKLYMVRYDNRSEDHATDELTLFSEHVLETGGTQLAYQPERESMVWVVKDNGKLATLTLIERAGLMGWTRSNIKDNLDWGETEDACSMQNADSTGRNIFVVVHRTIDSVSARYVEMIPDAPLSGSASDGIYLDSHTSRIGSSSTTHSGYDHLEGETVGVMVDGEYKGTQTVIAGDITLVDAATTSTAGYVYPSTLVLFPQDAESVIGTTQGNAKNVHAGVLRLVETRGGTIGPEGPNLDPIEYETEDEDTIYTGDVEIPIDGDWARDATLRVRQAEPYPMTITGVVMRGNIGSRGGQTA